MVFPGTDAEIDGSSNYKVDGSLVLGDGWVWPKSKPLSPSLTKGGKVHSSNPANTPMCGPYPPTKTGPFRENKQNDE